MLIMIETDVCREESDDDAMDVMPIPKSKAKLAANPIRPRPTYKNSQHQAMVPNVADQRDLTAHKGSSTQKSNHIRKFLFFFQLAFRSNIERIDDRNDDVYADDAMDVQPKPKSKAKPATKPIQPKPITKTSQRQATVADQLDLASNKRSSSTRSIRKFFFLICCGYT
jgi:hypothetical protein